MKLWMIRFLMVCMLVNVCAVFGTEIPDTAEGQEQLPDKKQVALSQKPGFGTVVISGGKAVFASIGFALSVLGTVQGTQVCLMAISKLDAFKHNACIKKHYYVKQLVFSVLNKTLSLEKRIDKTVMRIYAACAAALLIGIPACLWWGKIWADSVSTFLDCFSDQKTL